MCGDDMPTLLSGVETASFISRVRSNSAAP